MSGKAYSFREMKSIVDYLVEQKAYGETKGRKMWVTFASSQLTTRTWQSLKETFLKRILPDIQNPYYKLTMEQVRSFKEGHDVEARSKSKLELQTVSDESTSNGKKETNGEKPTSTAKEMDLPSGEDIKSAPITRNRSSVDTLVLDDPYYSNAEEIQNVLENTTEGDINEELYKPLKDCLTFEQSEPFNIDAMRVLEDFATDSEGSEQGLRMDIDENPPNPNNKKTETESEDAIVIQDSEETQEVTQEVNPNNPIEAEVNVMVFGKETEDSNDQQPAQIPDKDEAVPDNSQTDTIQKDSKIQQPIIINDQPVVISDQSDINNDEDDNNMDTEADVSNANNNTSEVLLTFDTSAVNNDQVENANVNNDRAKKTEVNNDQVEYSEVNNDQAKQNEVNNDQPEEMETTDYKQDKVAEKVDKEKVDKTVTPLPENKSPAKPKSPETVQTKDITISDKEKKEKTPESPKKVRISQSLPNSNVTVNTSSNITDSLIPNNQEALNESDKTNIESKLQVTQEKTKKSRKRSSSHESERNKKIKLDEAVVKNEKENPTTNKEKTDMRKMESEDLFAHVDSQQNKETDKPGENKVTENEPNEDLVNNDTEKNPCLKSVSLFAEQFNTTKLLDSESEDENVEQSNSQTKEPKNNSKKPVKSSKQSDIDSIEPTKTSKQSKNNSKKPANNTEKTDKNSKENANNSKKPDNKPKVPATTSKQPDNNSKELADVSKQSDNIFIEPVNSSKQSINTSNSKIEFRKDPILLKSHSDSDDKPKASVSNAHKSEKVKDKVRKESLLAKMLGFGGNVSRKRRVSHRRSRTNRHSLTIDSDSSQWTSESDNDEYVSPPRGRRNRQARKILKPKSAKILSLNEEGGLFVMHGKKIYPLMKDGKNVKSYLNYHVDSDDSEEEEHSYWRQKYVQEKIRADELAKRLRSKETRISDKSDVPIERKSPILQSNTSLRIPSHKLHNESTNKVFDANDKGKEPVKSKATSSQEKLKICFSKNNQEVQLEGYWPQIHPALQQVVELLHTDDNPNGKSKQNPKQNEKPVYKNEESNVTSNKEKSEDMEIESLDIDSGKTTPIIPTIDPETHEKVSKIESVIFKEIEERAKEEEPKSESDNINTTKRNRGRPTKASLSLSTSKTENQPEITRPASRHSRKSSKNETNVSTSKQDQKEELTSKSVQKKESTTKSDQKELRKRDASTSKQVEKSNETVSKSDDAVPKRSSRAPKRLAEEQPAQSRMSTRRSTSRKPEQLDDDEIRYKLPPNKKDTKPTVTAKKSSRSNPEDLSLRSVESTQGYQDSDASPINTKRRRNPSFKVHKSKKRVKRISLPNLTELISSDSSNSSYFIPLRKSQSTLSSTVYKTDSYQLLMPKEKALTVLDSINEDQNSNEVRHFNSINNEEIKSNSSNIIVEICSSSNISLPLSPELSVVENLTLSREMIKPSISLNETELNKMDCGNVGNDNSKYDKYMISNIDVSCPLMEQECGLQNANESSNKKNKKPVSESLIDKVATVTMKEKSISDTINKKLHDLLLESAKKISNQDEKMDVDDTVKKAKPKKRSSTPRKRKTAKNQKQAQVNSLLEEEHIVEICSYAGRASCPPVITVIPPDENANFAKTPADKKTKKKKDVIKVKIQRPKSRARDKSVSSTKSSITDSGINDPTNFSGMFLIGNDSVDLIHNHSDTCLNANECIGDSIQFIDNSVKSVISLSSTSSDSELKRLMESADKSMDTFSSDAQGISACTKLPNLVEEIFRSPSATFPSPVVTNSSLITEDLSNSPPPPTKWYLLSEDDTNTQVQEARSCGSNLNQIFTACAVPNLSTITERSVDSRKVKDGDTQNCDSQSLF